MLHRYVEIVKKKGMQQHVPACVEQMNWCLSLCVQEKSSSKYSHVGWDLARPALSYPLFRWQMLKLWCHGQYRTVWITGDKTYRNTFMLRLRLLDRCRFIRLFPRSCSPQIYLEHNGSSMFTGLGFLPEHDRRALREYLTGENISLVTEDLGNLEAWKLRNLGTSDLANLGTSRFMTLWR